MGYFNRLLFLNALLFVAVAAALTSVVVSGLFRQTKDDFLRESEKTFGILYNEMSGKHDAFYNMLVQVYEAQGIERIMALLGTDDDALYDRDPLLRHQLFQILDLAAAVDEDIIQILIYKRRTGTFYRYDRSGRTFGRVEKDHPFCPELSGKQGGKMSIGARNILVGNREESCFAICGNLGTHTIWDPPGYIAAVFSTRSFARSIENFRSDVPARYAVQLLGGETVFDTMPGLPLGQAAGDYAQNIFSDTTRDYQYLAQISREVILERMRLPLVLVVLGAGSLMLLFFGIHIASLRSSAVRVKELLTAMERVGKNELERPMHVRGTGDEFDKIAENFNAMQRDLRDNIEKAYLYELKRKTAELGELQGRINPHFLSNTIDSIRRKIVRQELAEVDDMMLMLARYYRMMVTRKPFVALSEEIEISKIYLDMMSLRYTERFFYSIDIEGELKKIGVVRNLLQPLLENFFQHGFNGEHGDNQLALIGKRQGDDISLVVLDNGRGIEADRLAAVKQSLVQRKESDQYGYGLASVYERMKIVYGTRFDMDLDSAYGVFTKISLRFEALSLETLNGRMKTSGAGAPRS